MPRQADLPTTSCYFEIAGITLVVNADAPLALNDFHPSLQKFAVPKPGKDCVCLRQHAHMPGFDRARLGELVYRRPPWEIYRDSEHWTYLGIQAGRQELHQAAVFNPSHTQGDLYSPGKASYEPGERHAVSFQPTDQILLAPLLADRQGCLLHAAGLTFDGQGLLFGGHSEAGKSTITRMLGREDNILCDDRIIVRRWQAGFRMHGTWSHGEVEQVSPASAPLKAVLLLEKAAEHRLVRVEEPRAAMRALIGLVVRGLETVEWWQKTLDVMEKLVREVPVYRLEFNRTDREGLEERLKVVSEVDGGKTAKAVTTRRMKIVRHCRQNG